MNFVLKYRLKKLCETNDSSKKIVHSGENPGSAPICLSANFKCQLTLPHGHTKVRWKWEEVEIEKPSLSTANWGSALQFMILRTQWSDLCLYQFAIQKQYSLSLEDGNCQLLRNTSRNICVSVFVFHHTLMFDLNKFLFPVRIWISVFSDTTCCFSHQANS